MQDSDYANRVDAAKRRAYGRWTQILASLGLDERMLGKRPMACPLCAAGEDRFQYTDKFGQGNYHCRKCGPGGGFKLLQACKGMDFNTALRAVEAALGMLPEAFATTHTSEAPERMSKLVQRIWSEAKPIAPGDCADRYLRGRGLALPVYPPSLRFHPALGYFQKAPGAAKASKAADYPALLASIQALDGTLVTLHRTYLSDGRKLPAADAKKVLSGGFVGASVRLGEAHDELAVCEGIETGIAIAIATGKPVWCALGAGNLEKLQLPAGVRKVCIYADNDADGDFTGQASAYALARRLKREQNQCAPREVRVHLPRQTGADWADVWLQRQTVRPLRAA